MMVHAEDGVTAVGSGCVTLAAGDSYCLVGPVCGKGVSGSPLPPEPLHNYTAATASNRRERTHMRRRSYEVNCIDMSLFVRPVCHRCGACAGRGRLWGHHWDNK